MNKAAKQYYKDVYHAFPTHAQHQKAYLKNFYDFLKRYSQQHPQEEYLDYIESFGEPIDIVAAFYERMDNQTIISHMKLSHMIKYNFIVFGSIFLIIFFAFVYMKYQEYIDFHDSESYYFETIIEEDI